MAPIVPGPLARCPACGSGELAAVDDGELTNFWCRTCRRCWHVELGWMHQIAPRNCPGCSHRDECVWS